MRLRPKEKSKIFKRKKIWETFGWGIPEYFFSFFRKNHSLNCGCAHCRGMTWSKRYQHRQERRREKKIIQKELEFGEKE